MVYYGQVAVCGEVRPGFSRAVAFHFVAQCLQTIKLCMYICASFCCEVFVAQVYPRLYSPAHFSYPLPHTLILAQTFLSCFWIVEKCRAI